MSLESAWDRVIPNHRLTMGVLPAPDAGWETLYDFAHTFDGYAVRADLPQWQPRWLAALEGGPLPELSLTMARTLLFGFARWHHMTDYGSPPAEHVRYSQALTERIRERVSARAAGLRPTGGTTAAAEDGVIDAYERLVEQYAQWGGYRFHGWTDYGDTRNFQGPVIWSEADCVLRYAIELEREFPRCVHLEFAIGRATRADYEPGIDKRQRVDIAVSDLSAFVEDESSQQRFRTHAHEAFIEAKWLLKGWRGQQFEHDAIKRVGYVREDLNKLARHLELGRCRVAAALIVDDEDYFVESGVEAPPGVWSLVVGPRALERRGLLHAS